MVGINHIAGGVAVTATMCSFSDINLFSRIEYLIVCVIGSLISDIDHTKSLLGRLFLPISKYVAKNYGHRTITHSLIFILFSTLFVYFLEYFTISNITQIFFYALVSHVVLDMLTVQGVPFLYPFSKLIFVIPGDAKMRIQNKNIKSQATAFVVFIAFIFFSYNLFQNGFWSTYNKSFSKIKHVHNEVLRSENLIFCKSDLGNGYVIESNNSKLLLYSDSAGFFQINETDNYKETTPIKTEKKLKINELLLVDISTDSLNNLVKNKLIKEIKLNSSFTLQYFLGEQKQKKNISETYIKDIVFTETKDTSKAEIIEKLKLKKIRLSEINIKNQQINKEYLAKKNTYLSLKIKYQKANIEEKEIIYKQLKKVEQEAEQEKQPLQTTQILEEEIRYLQEYLQTKQKNKIIGIVKIINFNL